MRPSVLATEAVSADFAKSIMFFAYLPCLLPKPFEAGMVGLETSSGSDTPGFLAVADFCGPEATSPTEFILELSVALSLSF